MTLEARRRVGVGQPYVKKNFLRAARFQTPEWIPCLVQPWPSTWNKYGKKLDKRVQRYPYLFDIWGKNISLEEYPPFYREGEYHTDPWGCVWHNVCEGVRGQVIKHPLEKWSALSTYKIPDQVVWDEYTRRDWHEIKVIFENGRQRDLLLKGHMGYFYQRLHFLRGFKNLMIDFMTEPPQLKKLIDMMVEEKLKLIYKWLEIGVDVINFGDDLGTRNTLQISPAIFRKYLKPAYDRMMSLCRKADCVIRFHSDGYIIGLIDEFIDLGINIINVNYTPNGLDNLVQRCKGRICVDLMLDKQRSPLATPQEINNHVKEAVVKLGAKEGGLMLSAGIPHNVSLINIEATCKSLDEYRFFYA